MALSFTANTNLQKSANGDTGWDTPIRANYDTIDAYASVGPLAVALTEVPSASLNIKVGAGTYRKSDGTVGTYAGTSSQAMTTAATNSVYILETTGALTISTSGFPANSQIVRLATVVAGASTITSITDVRTVFTASVTTAPTPSVAAGAGAGTSPTVTITGSDTYGYITVVTGTSPTGTATVATITFGQTRAAIPKVVVIGPGSINVPGVALAAPPSGYLTTGWTLTVGTALAGSTTYIVSYAIH